MGDCTTHEAILNQGIEGSVILPLVLEWKRKGSDTKVAMCVVATSGRVLTLFRVISTSYKVQPSAKFCRLPYFPAPELRTLSRCLWIDA